MLHNKNAMHWKWTHTEQRPCDYELHLLLFSMFVCSVVWAKPVGSLFLLAALVAFTSWCKVCFPMLLKWKLNVPCYQIIMSLLNLPCDLTAGAKRLRKRLQQFINAQLLGCCVWMVMNCAVLLWRSGSADGRTNVKMKDPCEASVYDRDYMSFSYMVMITETMCVYFLFM